ncbi:MAG: NUDIX domain-containing protein [Bacteroidetes bacterium]|nr:MAG: NUDIX domain-containing protein [Bacteroidota bacterium]
MNRFNLRVYGLYIQDHRLLVTDEIRFGIRMTKLPGGGLKFGEGLAQGLQREWQEELAVDIEVGDIVYVNPFLQHSAFDPNDEVICFYFQVTPLTPLRVAFRTRPMDFPTEENNQQVFRWIPLADLQPEDFTFPIDQALVPKLKAAFGA